MSNNATNGFELGDHIFGWGIGRDKDNVMPSYGLLLMNDNISRDHAVKIAYAFLAREKHKWCDEFECCINKWNFHMLTEPFIKRIKMDLKQILLPELANVVVDYLQGASENVSS